MEVWQVAAMLGLPDEPPGSESGPGVRSGDMGGRDLTAERFRHLTGRGPAPEAEATGTDLVQMMEGVGLRG